MEKTLPYIVIDIQSVSDVITNSSSEVVIRMNRRTVSDIKDLVNSLLKKFTELKFDDLFVVQYVVNDDNLGNLLLDEDDPKVDEYISEDEERWGDDRPSLSKIKISSKPGRGLEEAARLLSDIDNFFYTDIYYG